MKTLNNYIQKAQSALFDEMGVFFAFGDEQFNKSKKEGVTYTSLGMGIFCPIDNAKLFIEKHRNIVSEGMKADLAENGKEAIIKRALRNYESYYTGCIEDATESVLEYGFTEEDVYQVYKANRAQALED